MHVVDYFATAIHAEVHVEVRHGFTLRVEKTLEHQVETEGFHLGNADKVGNYAACAAAASRAYGYAVGLGVVDEVPHNKVVIDKAHAADYAVFVLHALADFRRAVGVLFLQTLFKQVTQIFRAVHSVGRRVQWQQLFLAEVDVALFGNFQRGFHCVGDVGEQLRHFVVTFEIKFLSRKAHTVGVVEVLARLYAQHDVLNFGVFLVEVVNVVGDHHFDVKFPCERDKLRHDRVFVVDAVLLYFDVVILTEKFLELQRQRACVVGTVGKEKARQLPRDTRRQTDDTFVVLDKRFPVDTRLVIKAFYPCDRVETAQVVVANVVFGKQDKVEVFLVFPASVVQIFAHVKLATDDGFNSGGFGGVEELPGAVHIAVVGDGYGRHFQFLALGKHFVNARRAVKKAVFGV